MLTQDRAKEVRHQQNQFPYWGNYSKFMTEDEIAHVQYIWEHAKSGNVTFASIVDRIANGTEPWELRDGIPTYAELNHILGSKN